MGLRLVIGRSGAGKTSLCLDEIHEIERRRTRRSYLLVPEQCNLEAERRLIERSGQGALRRASVTTFRRLSYRVSSEVGGRCGDYIAASGKRVLAALAAERLRGSCEAFARQMSCDGFTESLYSLFAEFKQSSVGADELQAASDKILGASPQTARRVGELARLYAEYCALARGLGAPPAPNPKASAQDTQYAQGIQESGAGTALVSEDDLTWLATAISRSEALRDAAVYVDGFSGFTAQERAVLAALTKHAFEVTVCLCCDSVPATREDISEFDLFAPTKRTACDLAEDAARAIGAPTHRVQRAGSAARASTEQKAHALRHLERHLFSLRPQPYDASAPVTHDARPPSFAALVERNPFDEQPLAFVECGGRMDEAELAAADILRMCRVHGLRFGDIAVICSDLHAYAKPVRQTFARHGISCFIDQKDGVEDRPLPRALLSALAIGETGYGFDAVFSYLKTGLSRIEPDAVDALENCALARGIRGRSWLSDDAWPEPLHEARASAIDPISRLLASASVQDSPAGVSADLYAFIEDSGALSRMEAEAAALSKAGKHRAVSEMRQEWACVAEALDQVNAFCQEPQADALASFRRLFIACVKGCRIGTIPPSSDEVLVGGADRTRSRPVKLLYVLGATEGAFPARPAPTPLLCDQDRAALRDAGVAVKPDSVAASFDSDFAAYSAITLPSRFLRILWPTAAQGGKTLKPARVVRDMHRLFPNAPIWRYSSSSSRLRQFASGSPDAALEGLVLARREQRARLAGAAKRLPAGSSDSGNENGRIVGIGSGGGGRIVGDIGSGGIGSGGIVGSGGIGSGGGYRGIVGDSGGIGSGGGGGIVGGIGSGSGSKGSGDRSIGSGGSIGDGEAIAPFWKAVENCFRQTPSMNARLSRALERFDQHETSAALPPELAGRLLRASSGEPRGREAAGAAPSDSAEPYASIAVSRLERYASCPFSYFARYALGIQPRKQMHVEAPDIGTFVHRAVELGARAAAEADDWANLGDEDIARISDEAVFAAMHDTRSRKLSDGERNSFVRKRARSIVFWSLRSIARHIIAGRYVPWGFEERFDDRGARIRLADGRRIALRGAIDRIDIAYSGNRAHVRVIDYKTGKKHLSRKDIDGGLSFQLPVYLDAALELAANRSSLAPTQASPPGGTGGSIDAGGAVFSGGSSGPSGASFSGGSIDAGGTGGTVGFVPGGMFYMEAKQPMLRAVQKGGRKALKYEQALLSDTSLDGIFFGDPQSYQETVDHSGGACIVKSVRFRKDGQFYVNKRLEPQAQYDAMRITVTNNARAVCERLLGGDYSVSPRDEAGGASPCRYCALSGACGVDFATTA